MPADSAASMRRSEIALALARTALGPLLLAQGLYVRRVTPRLAEAGGERSGAHGAGAALRLLLAGDSAAAGVGAGTQQAALAGRLVADLGADHHVVWRLIAASGHAIDDVIEQLAAAPAESFDVAALSVGVNDVIAGTSPARWRASQSRLIGLLATRFGVRRALLSAIPPMQHFPALPNPLGWYLGRRAALLNQVSEALWRDDPRCVLVRPAFALNADLIASDGFHPGPAACALWARQLAHLIRAGMFASPRSDVL